jgi:hypothetical protein
LDFAALYQKKSIPSRGHFAAPSRGVRLLKQAPNPTRRKRRVASRGLPFSALAGAGGGGYDIDAAFSESWITKHFEAFNVARIHAGNGESTRRP